MNQLVGFIFFIFLFSCNKEDLEKEGPCGVKNPIEDLNWLKKEIESFSKPPDLGYAYFTKKYKGERVFWLYSLPTVGNLEYRTCDGKRYYMPSPLPEDKETQDFSKLILGTKEACPYVIWNTPYYQKLTACP